MTSPQPFPSPGQSQPESSGQDLAPYAAVMGVQQGANRMNVAQMRKQQMESVEMQVRSITEMVDGIAKQFPAAAQETMALKAGLTRMLVRIVGSSTPESQPQTGAMG
jgi:hypothetical protein